MRLIIVVIALVASEIAYAAPVPRPRPLDAPARASHRVADVQMHGAIPVPRARALRKSARKFSTAHETKHADAATLRVASAVPMPYQRPSIAGVRTEGASIVPKTIPVAPVKQPEVKAAGGRSRPSRKLLPNLRAAGGDARRRNKACRCKTAGSKTAGSAIAGNAAG